MATQVENIAQFRAEPVPITVRRALPSDLDALVDLERECFRSIYRAHQFDHADFTGYIDARHAIALVASADDELAGYVAGSDRRLRGIVTAVIDSLAVTPRYRSRGIGRRLVAGFISHARRAGCDRVILEVGVENVAALHLYRAMGFVPYRTIPDYYAPGNHARRLRLDLR